MTSPETAPSTGGKARLEAFSDGVFAIAITLLVPFREVGQLLFKRT